MSFCDAYTGTVVEATTSMLGVAVGVAPAEITFVSEVASECSDQESELERGL